MSVSVAEESGREDPWLAAAAADKALVDETLDQIKASVDKWEAILAEMEASTFEASLGDVAGVVNSDGRLIEFSLAPDVMSTYTYTELQDRINTLLGALHQAVLDDYAERWGSGGPLE